MVDDDDDLDDDVDNDDDLQADDLKHEPQKQELNRDEEKLMHEWERMSSEQFSKAIQKRGYSNIPAGLSEYVSTRIQKDNETMEEQTSKLADKTFKKQQQDILKEQSKSLGTRIKLKATETKDAASKWASNNPVPSFVLGCFGLWTIWWLIKKFMRRSKRKKEDKKYLADMNILVEKAKQQTGGKTLDENEPFAALQNMLETQNKEKELSFLEKMQKVIMDPENKDQVVGCALIAVLALLICYLMWPESDDEVVYLDDSDDESYGLPQQHVVQMPNGTTVMATPMSGPMGMATPMMRGQGMPTSMQSVVHMPNGQQMVMTTPMAHGMNPHVQHR